MLDINLFQVEKGGDPEMIKESQRKRGASVEIVDEIIALYKEWTAVRFDLDQLNKEINVNQKAIGAKMKAKEDASELLTKKNEMADKKKELEKAEQDKNAVLMSKAATIGNIVHSSVPVSMDEENNEVLRTWCPEGVTAEKRDCLSHHEVLTRLDGYDPERGVKITGHRGYFLRQYGVFLNQALINYGLNFLADRGYIALQTPQMMNKDVMAKTAQLSDFDEELYKVLDGDDEKYLIATSEQPISAFHANEWFESPAEQLPIKYAGYSSCYRREAGSHGKDAWGIFRVHTFEKVEQFLLTEPEKSWEAFEDMVANSEEFMKSLGLPYRLISIVSGALNNAAAKKYDLEAWFPFQGEYKELVSTSNCTDYQSRSLEIRCGVKKMGDREKKYVHCLNGTLCATERTLCCILENYQTEDGFRVPEVLQPYMGGKTFLPFTRELPKNSTSQKKKAEKK
ncbi:Cytosolic seryl-tRNA synthetase [Saitoella coloradoensis]